MKKIITSVLVVIMAIVIAVLLILNKRASPTIGRSVAPPVKVQQLSVTKAPLVQPIFIYAKPEKMTEVSSFVTGIIEQVLFAVREHVKKGQKLLVIDPKTQTLHVEKQQAAVRLIKANIKSNNHLCELKQKLVAHAQKINRLEATSVKRFEQLQQDQYAAKATLDQAKQKLTETQSQLAQQQFELTNCQLETKRLEAQLDQRQADLKLAEKNLKETIVYAPYDGEISQQFVDQGQTVNPGQKLFTIFNMHHLQVVSLLSQSMYQQVRQVDKNRVFACRDQSSYRQGGCYPLAHLSHSISSAGVGYEVIFQQIDKQWLIANQRQRWWLVLPKVSAYALPSAALHHQTLIYLVKDHQLHMVKVKLIGKTFGGKILIEPVSHLSGSTVLVSSLPGARNGLQVRLIKS